MSDKEKSGIGELLGELGGFGDHLTIEQVRDQELMVESFELLETGFGLAAIVTIELDGNEATFLTWSQVILDQLAKIKDHLPLDGMIVKVKNYFTFQ